MHPIPVLMGRLELALDLAITDIEESQTPDPFRNSDYDWRRNRMLERLAKGLRTGTYSPEPPLLVALPKSEFAVRPGKRVRVEDLTVLFYIVLGLASVFEDRLRAGVTAYRVRQSRAMISPRRRYILPRYLRRRHNIIDPWYDAWPKFHKRLQAEYELGRRFVGTSDITSFYEAIDLGLMRRVLLDQATRPIRPLVHLASDMYLSWSARDVQSLASNRGIPQGTNTSGVIANYFLVPFDNALRTYARSKRLTWYRYSDDLRLVGRDREAVRYGLRMIGHELSKLNLLQQSSKTEILTGRRARYELFDPRPGRIERARAQLRTAKTIQSKAVAVRKLDRILETVGPRSDADKLQSRTLAMLYGAYREAGSDHLLRRWQRDLVAEPQRSETIMSYVGSFLGRPGVARDLLEILDRRRDVATDWELAMMLRTFRRARILPPGAGSILLELATRKSRNWYVRQQAICCIGWFRLERQARTLIAACDREWDDEVRRSIVTLSFLLDVGVERNWLAECARDLSQPVSRMANFLLALRSDAALASEHIKRFSSPNEIFMVDNAWRLYHSRLNQEPGVQARFARALQRLETLAANPHVRAHIEVLRGTR